MTAHKTVGGGFIQSRPGEHARQAVLPAVDATPNGAATAPATTIERFLRSGCAVPDCCSHICGRPEHGPRVERQDGRAGWGRRACRPRHPLLNDERRRSARTSGAHPYADQSCTEVVTVNHEALAAEIESVERRLALIDTLIPEAEKPLHRLWEMRSQERDLLEKLRSRQRSSRVEHYANLEAEARDQAEGRAEDFRSGAA